MMRRKPARRVARDEEGVSTIVGAVLVFAILIAVLGSIRVSFVPEWEKDAEWRHMNGAQGQMQDLLSLLDQQVNNVTAAPVSAPFGLGQGRASMFSGPHPAHELAVTEDPRSIQVDADVLTVIRENGVFLGSIDETWTPLSSSVSDASRVESFRLKLDSVETKNDGDKIILSILDADGLFAGDLQLTVTKHASDFSMQIVVRDAAEVVLYNQGDAFLDDVSPFFLDLLDQRYRFDQVLAAADIPFTVVLELENDVNGGDDSNGHADLAASYAITYHAVTSGGTVLTTSGGDTRLDFEAEYPGDQLLFRSNNNYFPHQDLVLENGAVILTQDEHAAFAVTPNFHASLGGDVTQIQMSLPVLDGEGSSFSAPRTTSVFLNTVGTSQLVGLAPQLSVSVETAYPELWDAFWTERLLELPGYASGVHFAVSTTATTATLVLYGITSDPASTVNDLVLDLRTADVNVRVSG